jgi:tRNA A-37 threonylcarbamoyl transferase component Bud32
LRESFDEIAEQVLSCLKAESGSVRSVSLHGAIALGYENEPYHVLVVLEGDAPPMFQKLKECGQVDLVITVGEENFEEDCADESLGGAIASLLLFPYRLASGCRSLDEAEVGYKRHVILESLQNLILDYRLASSHLLIRAEYFLFDKLRKLSAIHLPVRRLVKSCFQDHLAESLRLVLPGYERALDDLVSQGILVKKGECYSPSEEYVLSTLSRSSAFLKLSRELEHSFKLYLSASLSSPIESLRELAFDPMILRPVKFPEPSRYIERETALGPQPLHVELGLKDFVETLYGVEPGKIRIKRAASALNSAYIIEFPLEGSRMRIFAKKYLNWTDFKWVAAWLWAIGVKNFSLLASIRMGNEIYFMNKLMELGFNTAEILHVNWSGRILFQKFVEGFDLARVLRSFPDTVLAARAREVGMLLAKLHENGICLGDCNPSSFILATDGRIYVVDLEQCSYDNSYTWDVAELLYYSARYLKSEQEDIFLSGVIDGYAEIGDVKVIEEAMESRYARVLAPLILPRSSSEFREKVMQLARR